MSQEFSSGGSGGFDAIVALLVAAFAAFVGLSQQLSEYKPGTLIAHIVGAVFMSACAGMIVGFYVADQFPGRLGIILPAAGIAGAGGAKVISVALAKMLERVKGGPAAGGNGNGNGSPR